MNRDKLYEEFKTLSKLYDKLYGVNDEIENIQINFYLNEDFSNPLEDINNKINELIDSSRNQANSTLRQLGILNGYGVKRTINLNN